ncbi:MAG: CpaF family protein [Lachnospiraceae bacterium]|jgi:pilus assembly protein CpaF|nr:CpaF family protein [Lachnospiraceae bacterium]
MELSLEVKEKLRAQVRAVLCERTQITDEEVHELIDDALAGHSQEKPLTLRERTALSVELFNSFRRLGNLQKVLDDPAVTEIMINGADHIYIEKYGKPQRLEGSFSSPGELEDMIQQMVSRINRRVNVANPIADARLPDGSRVHIVLPPVSLCGPVVTIRKFPRAFTMAQLVDTGALTPECAAFLEKLVVAGYNIFISGGTNSGKTTFLNALSAFIPKEERIITIEDSAELQIQHAENLVRMETRNPNEEGEGGVTIGDLIRASLRMNPSRIIVGEVRGKEALELLNSYNTGHDGGMSTGHANSCRDMLARLETMVLTGANLPLPAIRSQIASALDVMVHLGRLRDRSRKVLEIVEVGGYRDGEIQTYPLYRFEEHRCTEDAGSGEDVKGPGNGFTGETGGGNGAKGPGNGCRGDAVGGKDIKGPGIGCLRKTGELRSLEKLGFAGITL